VRAGRFNLERARELGVREGPDFGRLQRGESVVAPRREDREAGGRDGRRPRRDASWCWSGDTRPASPCAGGAPRGRPHPRVDLLRPTTRPGRWRRATRRPRRPGRVAQQAGAHRLILTHLSSRYDTRLRAAARAGTRGVPGPGGGRARRAQRGHPCPGMTVERPRMGAPDPIEVVLDGGDAPAVAAVSRPLPPGTLACNTLLIEILATRATLPCLGWRERETWRA
jgi:hypothetical protein